MLLQQILHQLDAELERVEKIRSIVVELEKSPILLQNLPSSGTESLLHIEPEHKAEGRQRPRFKVKVRREPKKRTAAALTAPARQTLTSAIPSGPVVVSPQALARERAFRVVARETAKVSDLRQHILPTEAPETLVRNLTERWLSGLGAAS